MSAKKNTFRFTVQLNGADAQHIRAADILNSQGRHKAQFIVNAIMHYTNCGESQADVKSAASLSYSSIEAIVYRILQSTSGASVKPKSAESKQSVKSESLADTVELQGLEQKIDTEALSAITDSVNAFRAISK